VLHSGNVAGIAGIVAQDLGLSDRGGKNGMRLPSTLRILPVLLVVGLTAAGYSAATPARTTARTVANSTVTIADAPGAANDYIFPVSDFAGAFIQNILWFSAQLYPPLYAYGLNGIPDELSPTLSLAYPPKYLDNDTEVEITLKPRKWSDGTQVTARDIEFFVNMLEAGKDNFEEYVPGQFPDNVSSMTSPNPSTVILHLNASYNPSWFTYAELPLITPIPQHAWDRTSAGGPIGNYDETPAGATAVYNFLSAQSSDLSTYDTDPLWRVVDGPFALSSFDASTGYTVLVPNKSYDGSDPASIKKLIEEPFTSNQAELDALESGSVTYGYLPLADSDLKNTLQKHGFKIDPWPSWGAGFIHVNFTNPKTKPLLSQLYVRQVMQRSIDQPVIIKKIFGGYAIPSYGLTPTSPHTRFLTPEQSKNPYPYDPAASRKILEQHGWHVVPDGTTTCATPSLCGPGISKGEAINFTMYWFIGYPQMEETAEQMESALANLGIHLTLRSAPIATYYSIVTACTTGPSCNWDFGTDFYIYVPGPWPQAAQFTATGSPGNAGYASPTLMKYLGASTKAKSLTPYYEYENFLATQLPLLYYPMGDFQVSVISNKLVGASVQDPIGEIVPQLWKVKS
jgi:peptide/nickel transport system substrate-binding protein